MNGLNIRLETGEATLTDDLIEYDPNGSEEPEQEIEINENEVKTIYIEFIKNYHQNQNKVTNDLNLNFVNYNNQNNKIKKDNCESVSCNVKYCKSINILNTELEFFCVPASVWSSNEKLTKWKQALAKDNDESLPIDFRICEKHFRPEHIEFSKHGGKILNRFAIPCLDLPPREDTMVPYFSDIDSIEQYIKGSAESYILDMKSRSISEDSLESTNNLGQNGPSNGPNGITVKMEVTTEDLKTVVKPVTISSSSAGTFKMFTTPLRKVNHQNVQSNSTDLINLNYNNLNRNNLNSNEPVIITKLSASESRSTAFKRKLDNSQEGSSTNEAEGTDKNVIQIINPRASKRSKSICSVRSTTSLKEVSAIQKVKPMQQKVVPIVHNDLLAARRLSQYQSTPTDPTIHVPSPESQPPASIYFPKKILPNTSNITSLENFEKRPFNREENDAVQIKLSGPVTFQLCDRPTINYPEPNNFASSIRTEKQLKAMCGLNNFSVLDLLIDFHRDVEDIPNIKSRLILTFIKLKTNISFTFLSTIFGYDEKTAQKIFQQTIKTLALVFEDIDFNYPNKPSDGSFLNFKFSLECFEMQAEDKRIKLFIKISENGVVKFIGKSFSDRGPFLIEGLEKGDCIWLGKGVKPSDIVCGSAQGVCLTTRKKRVNVVSRVLSIMTSLKFLEGRISLGLLPQIKNIMNTICGVCNLMDRC